MYINYKLCTIRCFCLVFEIHQQNTMFFLIFKTNSCITNIRLQKVPFFTEQTEKNSYDGAWKELNISIPSVVRNANRNVYCEYRDSSALITNLNHSSIPCLMSGLITGHYIIIRIVEPLSPLWSPKNLVWHSHPHLCTKNIKTIITIVIIIFMVYFSVF